MMRCKFKGECPSYSGWCETPIEDFSRCIPFIINAVKTAQKETAALRQQLGEKNGENAGLRTRCNHLMVKSSDLEDKLARVIAERDAAIDEIYYMGKRFNDCPTCNAYRTPECSVRCEARKEAPSISCWEWRGLEKEDTKNDN